MSLPDVGDEVEAGERFGDIDSVKAVSDLYAPMTGEVVAVNEGLDDEPEVVNESPYDKGWMVKLRPSGEVNDLLSPEAYAKLVADEG